MEEKIYYSVLFDLYGELLTLKQQNYFKDYYFENLTLEEIAEEENISKNAVSKQLKVVKNLLDYYEDKLHLASFQEKLRIEFSNEKEILKRISKCGNIIL